MMTVEASGQARRPSPAPSRSPVAGIPLGLFNVYPASVRPPFNLVVIPGDPARLIGHLDEARRAGRKVIVNFAGGKYRNNFGPDGTFSFDVWRSRVDRFQSLPLESYIADGTLFANYLIDEPNDASSWGGKVVSHEMIERMARHSKARWPRLPTIVRTHVSWLAKAPFPWVYLDAGWSQYAARRGDVRAYRDAETAAARQSKLAVLFGLNIRDGGAVVSGCTPGGRPRTCSMSAAELQDYGATLASAPGCGLTVWQHDATYLHRPDIVTALAYVARITASHSPTPCH